MKYFLTSIVRLAGLTDGAFEIEAQPRSSWRFGDVVAAEVSGGPSGQLNQIELTSGRMVKTVAGDGVIGAFGTRCATLEAVGDWQAIGADGRFEALTSACVFGRCTSKSVFVPPLLSLQYRGHVLTAGKPCNLRDTVVPSSRADLQTPVLLVIGTSMESGKTMSACVLIRLLTSRGLRVCGVKLAGVGRYRDILAMSDAGADCIFDFVDGGLPSTCCALDEYQQALENVLARIANENVDVVVAELGASPLEPYNGEHAVERLKELVRFTILCASDPYAVAGVMAAYNTKPDLIAGRATATTAALDLLRKLCDAPALDLQQPAAIDLLADLLQKSGFGQL